MSTWRVDPKMAGLGTTNSIGVHVYDLLRFLIGSEVTMVSAFFDTKPDVMEEVNLSLLKFANGAMAQFSVHENVPFPHNDFVIYGSRGRILGRGLTRSRADKFAVVRSVPTMHRSTSPACIRWPPVLSAMIVCGTPWAPSSKAVSEAP